MKSTSDAGSSNSFQWIDLFHIPIETEEDFNFVRYDPYARSQKEYVYALVAVTKEVEEEGLKERN